MYLQIQEQIRRLVAAGDWPPGTELPSIRQLAVDLQVSVITIKRAYLELEREGVIVTHQGKGSRVAPNATVGPPLLERDLDRHLEAAAGLARSLGLDERALAARLTRAYAAHAAGPTERQEEDEP